MINSILSAIPLFSTLPPTELDALAASLSDKKYPAQTVLLSEGECGDKFFIVLDGQIAILKAMGSDDERLLGLRGVGEFIGEMSLLNRDGRRTASARVHTDARLLEMTRADFDALLTRVPTIAYEMLRVLSARLDEAHNNAIAELMERNRELAEAYAELQAAQEQIIEKVTDRESKERLDDFFLTIYGIDEEGHEHAIGDFKCDAEVHVICIDLCSKA